MININEIVAEILRVPVSEITEETSMESNPLWDSLSHMEIITTLENKFSINFTGNEIVEVTSLSKIKSTIAKKVGAKLET